MGSRLSPWLVVALVVTCAVAAASQVASHAGLFRRAAQAPSDGETVELVVHEVARCANGQAVLVLREKGGERRLAMPVGPSEAAALDRRLHGEKPDRPRLHDLAGNSIASLGGRVVRASIDLQTKDKVFLGHLTIASRHGSVQLESRATDSVVLALEAGAPIVAPRALLQSAGIDPRELGRGQNAKKARTARQSPAAPVHRI